MGNDFKFNIGGVTNWYDRFVAADIELISAYIEQCEISNTIAIQEYHKLKTIETEEVEGYIPTFKISFRDIDGSLFNPQDIYENVFPMLNRHSTLVIVMSMFEERLKQLCDWTDSHFAIRVSFKKKGSLIFNIKTYLMETIKLEFSDELKEGWNELIVLQSIRNNIVHNFGKYETKNHYIDAFINSNKNIAINESNEFVFNHEFLKDLVPNFNRLCIGLQNAIRNKSSNS
ncbi:hypothetical protein OE09_1207 [Flavobacteriaceae bacterium MAR_2010_72]|nr:hypothetical protein OE09_1207 [Flavobacteriaceae bacterium MAR_2010_72]